MRILLIQKFLQWFCNIKHLGNGEITLEFTDVGRSCPSHEFDRYQSGKHNFENRMKPWVYVRHITLSTMY